MTYSYAEHRIDLSYEAIDLFGLARGSGPNTYRAIVRAIAPVDRAKVLIWIWDNVVNIPDVYSEFSIEVRSLHGGPAGGQQWLRLKGRFDPTSPGSRVVYFTVKDITQSKRAAERQAAIHARDQRRLRDLERLNRDLVSARQTAELSATTQARFLSVMSRDIRTPLNSLLGMLSLIDHQNLSEDEAAKLRSAENAGEQLKMLFDDLNDIAQGEVGDLKLDQGTHELSRLLKDGCSNWAEVANSMQVDFSIHIDPSCPQWVEIDGSRIRQLLDRMLGQFTEASAGKSVTMRVMASQSDRLRFLVEAACSQESEDDLDFAQSEERAYRRQLCDRLVQSLGGQMGSASDQNCFSLWAEIPCSVSFSPRILDTKQAELLSSSGGPLKVLVAEDVLTNQIVVEGHLAQLGCECTCVGNGKAAVEALQKGNFDVVLMDMAMPVMDGASSIRAIRQLRDGEGQLPIIALTAYSRPEELEPMLQAGANGALIKPVNLAELRESLVSATSNS